MERSQSSPVSSNLNDGTDDKQPATNGHTSSFVFGEGLKDRVRITEQSSSNPKGLIDGQTNPKPVSPEKDEQDDNQDKEGPRKRPFEVLTGEEGKFYSFCIESPHQFRHF